MLIDNRYVPRHQKNFTICHWLNAISFLMLFLTALPLYADSFLFLYNIFVRAQILCDNFYLDADFRVIVGAKRLRHHD